MLETLIRQINEAVESGRDHSQSAPINIIIGNGNTVVIGNDNRGWPEEGDGSGASRGRKGVAGSHGLHECRQLFECGMVGLVVER